MTFYLIISFIVTIITKKITALTSEGNFGILSEPIPYDSPKPVPITAEDLGVINSDNENDINNSTESLTSQDRISYHHKKGYYPHRFSHHHLPHLHLSPYPHLHHRLPYHKPPRKKYRRGRKKPSSIRSPYLKMPYKSRKPILLSEVLRNGGRLPYTRIKPAGPVIKDYIDEEDLETSPFSPADTIEYPSPFTKIRPQSFEIAEDTPDVLPVQPIEEEIIIPPGIPNVKPYTSMVKRPTSSIWSLSKPSESYYDSDGSADSTRNVRYPNKPFHLDKDIANLLQKIKAEGLNADSQASSTETVIHVQNKDNITDLNAAISKLLFPFLSDTAIKQIQLYFKSLPSDKQHKGDFTDNQFKDNSKNTTHPTNQYSVTESVKEDDSDNSTYFIMVKSPSYKGLNITKLLTQQFNQQRWQSDNQTERTKLEPVTNTTAPVSKESLALQKYIMMLAGISKDAGNSENYLPRFNTFQKQAKQS